MAITQASTGLSGPPLLGRFAGVTSTPNMRSGTYTIACRLRWATTATNVDMLIASLSVSSASGAGFFLQRRSGDPAGALIAYRYDGFITFHTAITTTGYGSTTAWVHFAATYDGTTIRTYVDGVASGTAASATTLIANSVADAITIAGPFTGDTADIVMFRRALTAAEIQQLAKARLPLNRRSDLVGWWPTFDPTSVVNAALDYSTIGNHCTIQSSGAGNPTATHLAVPVKWGRRNNRIIYVPQAVNQATATGLTQCTGAADNDLGTTALGNTQCTGNAQPSLSAPSTGLTQCTGAAVPRAGAVATGLTQTTGDAGNSLRTAAAGTTQTTGAATASVTGASAAGLSNTTGAAVPTASAQASGLSQTTGAAANNLGTQASGLTQCSGSGSAPGGASCTGTTQTTGTANASSVTSSCSGTAQCTGTATFSISATATGLTQCSGATGPCAVSAPASGLTQCTGVANGSSSGGGGGGFAAGKLAPENRRMWDATGGRRHR